MDWGDLNSRMRMGGGGVGKCIGVVMRARNSTSSLSGGAAEGGWIYIKAGELCKCKLGGEPSRKILTGWGMIYGCPPITFCYVSKSSPLLLVDFDIGTR